MSLFELEFSSLPKENSQILLELTPRPAVISLSAALLWEAQMLCWLTFGEHEALKRDMKRIGFFILT